MKKKIYINPEMEIVKIAANQQMLAGSQTVGFGEGTQAGGSACGRDYDFDEDDEEF